MCKCKGNNADISLWSSGSLQKMFCKDNTNGRKSKIITPQMCNMQSEDIKVKTNIARQPELAGLCLYFNLFINIPCYPY